MSLRILTLVWVLLLLGAATPPPRPAYAPSQATLPAPLREWRGVWVATVKNIDWPSKPGLPPAQQKAELLALFDKMVLLRLNAVMLQVRPACDAFYASKLEPWSEFLTGTMGQPPAPFYDPLAFAVQAAHERGLELHAWFNPFRARHPSHFSGVSSQHISRTHPQWVRNYGGQSWLDPGEPGVREYVIGVIMDVIRRYDVDGVHLDDYFYPYPEKDSRQQLVDFPDWASWKKYREANGKLSRGDWRRQNVDEFIQRLRHALKAEKPQLKFGISPFGIWRPGHPPQVKGFDAFASLYADSRKWLQQGWVDYLAPQLYWAIDSQGQSFPALLKWWMEQNTMGRHLYAGCDGTSVGSARPAAEIVRQVRLTRQQFGASGNVHWSAKALWQNRGGLAEALRNDVYTQQALPPVYAWLNGTRAGAPTLNVDSVWTTGELKLKWRSAEGARVALWLLQTKINGEWRTEILPGPQTTQLYPRTQKPEMIALRVVDRSGQLGHPMVLEKQKLLGP